MIGRPERDERDAPPWQVRVGFRIISAPGEMTIEGAFYVGWNGRGNLGDLRKPGILSRKRAFGGCQSFAPFDEALTDVFWQRRDWHAQNRPPGGKGQDHWGRHRPGASAVGAVGATREDQHRFDSAAYSAQGMLHRGCSRLEHAHSAT